MGSALCMEGVGLAWRAISSSAYALERGSEQGFGIGEKVAHDCVDRPDDAAFGWRNHRHRSCPFWPAPADNPTTLLAAACNNCFDSCSSLTARERTTAPTIVERMAMALPLGSSPSASPTQRPSIWRYSLMPASNDAFTSTPCRAASEPSATIGQPSILSARCSMLR